jgi:transposase
MRGDDLQQAGMFSYLSPEQRVPKDHPLRAIRKITEAVFVELSPQFDKMYARLGRPSIAPEKLLRALLLQVLYSVRSERLLMEELNYNMLFSLVRGTEHGRPGLGPDHLHEESRAVVAWRHR